MGKLFVMNFMGIAMAMNLTMTFNMAMAMLLYIFSSVWVLLTPNAGRNMLFS